MRGSTTLFFHNLPFANDSGMLVPEINLIVQAIRLVAMIALMTASTILPCVGSA
jgi:hypothetical protein